MRKTLCMFPGQGSQYVGMGKALLSDFPKSRTTFEEAEDASKILIRKLCLDGPEDELKLTANTQPCIVTVSVAMWRVLREETGLEADLFAGHSLGEYAALVAAEKLDFSRAVYLVRKRGEAMQEAVPAGVGAMAAVMKMPLASLEQICANHGEGEQSVEIVNYNSEAQLVIAGHKAAVDAVIKDVTEAGAKAVPLPVSAPFHSRLMAPARKKMTPLLMDSTFHVNAKRMIPNLTAEIVSEYAADYLIQQIDHPVLWMQSFEKSVEDGANTYIEVGPSKVLLGLARRALPRGETTLLSTEDMVAMIQALK